MRKLVLKISMSVDGMVGGPNGDIDWIFRTLDEDATDWVVDTLSRAGVHIMGSRTFRDMAAYYPTSTAPYAAAMNEIPKVYFSSSDEGAGATRAADRSTQGADTARSWIEARRAGGDLAEEIARLKQQPGSDILAHGGARFANSLVKLGLVDEFRLLVHPVVLGQGLALFQGLPAPLHLTLRETTTFDSGAVAHVYHKGLRSTVHGLAVGTPAICSTGHSPHLNPAGAGSSRTTKGHGS